MQKLIALLLSISLVFGSVTPSLAQSNKIIKGAGKALTKGSAEVAQQALPNAAKNAAGAGLKYLPKASTQFAKPPYKQVIVPPAGRVPNAVAPVVPAVNPVASSATVFDDEATKRLAQQINSQVPSLTLGQIQELASGANLTEQDAKKIYHQIFNVKRSASAKEFLLLNVLPSVTVEHGFPIGAKQAAEALEFYRRTLATEQAKLANMPSSASLEELLSPSSRNQEILTSWAKAMAAAANLGFFAPAEKTAEIRSVSSSDAALVRSTYNSVPKALKPITRVGVSNILLAMDAKIELGKFESESEFPAKLFENEQTAEKVGRLLSVWNKLNIIHLDPSQEATLKWLELNKNKGKIIEDPLASSAKEEAKKAAPMAAAPILPADVTIDLNNLEVADLSVQGMPVEGPKLTNKKLLKRARRVLEEARSEADLEFVQKIQNAKANGESLLLTSEDYNKLLSEKISAAVNQDARLAPYAADIQSSLVNERVTVPAKRELSFSLKMHDSDGKVLPVTFELTVRLLDNTAVKQFERLGINNSEVFTLMCASKDRKPKDPYELMLTTPGGSKRPIYEPFIEGGKAGIESLYYRLLGDYYAGKLTSNKITLNMYSDVYAERATLFAGLTEGLGGLPQATVAPQATALGITDSKSLQEGVSHSQLGNVASVLFSGLQKEFGIKKTLALGLGVASVGLGICGFALSLPTVEAKIAALGLGSFVLGVGANGGVKSTNSIFAKEMSNDNTSGTARMGFVNARASIGTMTGYLFFPVSVLFALTGLDAFQWLYYGATLVPAYSLFNLLLSKVRNVGAKHGDTSTLVNKMKVLGKRVYGFGKSVIMNFAVVLGGGYKERVTALREKRFIKERTKQYKDLLQGKTNIIQQPLGAPRSVWKKISDFMTLNIPAATSQYLLRMMLVVGLYHFAGMMYNSGPGAIIGKFIQSPEGADLVRWAQNLPMPITALLAGGLGYTVAKLAQQGYASLNKKFKRGPSENLAKNGVPETATGKVGMFTKQNMPWLVGGATTLTTAFVPQVYEVAHSIFSRFDPTSVAQIATFFTAYVGVWAGRQYLSKFVKTGKLSPQGIIGASGVLSTLAVGLAFIPGTPLFVKAILWGIAGLGFANLAGFENSLAMEKYPDQKPAVNMAYTLARLTGALTVLYGSLTKTFESMGIPEPDSNALVLPAGALALATLINSKYFTQNFVQDIKRWRGLPPTLSYKLLRSEADEFYKKYLKSDHSVEYREQDAQRIATDLFKKTRHDLAQIERVMKPIHEKLRLNQLRLNVINELKSLLNGAEQNNVPLGMEELTYKDLRTREIQPLLNSLSGKTLTPEQEEKVVHSVAGVIYNRYFIKAESLDDMERGIQDRNEGLDKFRLEVLRNMYKMELTKIAKDRVARYKGNRPSYDRAMDELMSMADKVLGRNHGWQAPAFEE